MNTNKTLGIILIISVALNLLVLGVLGGITFAGMRQDHAAPYAHPRTPPAGPYLFNPRAFIHALPPQARRKAHKDIMQTIRQTRQIRKNIRQTRDQLTTLLAAKTFDAEAVEQHFTRLRALQNEQDALGQMLLIKILNELPPDARRRAINAAAPPPSAHRPPPPRRHPRRQ